MFVIKAMASKLRPSPDHASNLDPPPPPPSQPSAELDQKITNEKGCEQGKPVSGEVQNQKPISQNQESASPAGLLYMKTVCEGLGNLVFKVKVREEVSEKEGSSLLGEHHEPGSEGSGLDTNNHASDEQNAQNAENQVPVINGNYGSHQQLVRPDTDDGGMPRLGAFPCKLNDPPEERNQAAKDKVKEREEDNSKRLVKTECKGAKDKVKEREKYSERSRKTEFKGAKAKVKERGENSERSGKTECKNNMLSGGCNYGKGSRYKHGKHGSPVSQIVESNFLGLPIRPGQRECPFYMRTGSCKYGSNCKFHHPDPSAAEVSDSGYGNGASGSGSGSYQDTSRSNVWSWSPTPMNDNDQFGPMMFPPTQEVSPQPELNAYQVQTIRDAYNKLGASRSYTDIFQIQMVINRVYEMLGHVLSSTEEVAASTSDPRPPESAAVQVPVVQPRRKQSQGPRKQHQRVGTRSLDEDDTSTSQQLQSQVDLMPRSSETMPWSGVENTMQPPFIAPLAPPFMAPQAPPIPDSPVHAATRTTIQVTPPSPPPSVAVLPSKPSHRLQSSLSSEAESFTPALTHHLRPSPTPNATPIQHTLRTDETELKPNYTRVPPPAPLSGEHPRVELKTNSGASMDGLTGTGLSNGDPVPEVHSNQLNTMNDIQKIVQDPMNFSIGADDGGLERGRVERRMLKKRVRVPRPIGNPVGRGSPDVMERS